MRAVALLAAAVVVLATAGTAAAKVCNQVSGDFTSVLVGPPACDSATGICTRGTLTGDLPSTYDFAMHTAVPDGAMLAYTGTSVITLDRGGALLFGVDTGTMDLSNPTAVPFVTTVSLDGGTKQYRRAVGTIVASGTLDLTTGLATGTYTGEVCKKPPR